MVSAVIMYRCENWTIRKAKHGKIYAFELWCWRRLLRVLWTARRSSQLVLKKSILNNLGRSDAETEATVLRPLPS